MKLVDLRNQRFGRLIVIDRAPNQGEQTQWRCLCFCGTTINVNASHLKNGHTKSCGCLICDMIKERSTKHGHKRRSGASPEYESWLGAKARCYRQTHKRYKDWGGRGITMCDRWLNSFEAFAADMGPRPEGTSLDRYPDNNGPYAPGNCRWATRQEQASNTHNGQTLSIAEWSRLLHISYNCLQTRLSRGWSIARALNNS
jgi:hypothetical protein